MRPDRLPRRASVVLTLVVAAGLAATGAVVADRPGGPGPVVMTVDAQHPGRPVPRSFAGFSIEYPSVREYLGSAAHPHRAVLALLRTLGDAQRGGPTLRIGGNSTDESWWNPLGAPAPPGILNSLTPDWLTSLAAAQRRLRSPLSLGVNLASGDSANAVDFARAALAALPAGSLRALEIGNEPDLYDQGRVSVVGDRLLPSRRLYARYGQPTYRADVARYVSALSGAVGHTPLGLGGFAGVKWDAALPPLVRADRGRVGRISAHLYPLRGCRRSRTPGALIDRLLSDKSSRTLLDWLAPTMRVARAARLPVQVAELNSAACGGARGVSDVFASALWMTDALFDLAHHGVEGVNVHTWTGATYAPFAADTRHGADRVLAKPAFYGMLLFAQATPFPSRLVPVHLDAAGEVRGWAAIDASHTVHVVAINRSARTSRGVRLVVRGARAAKVSIARLRAPSRRARDHVTLAGQSLGRDGRLHGAPTTGTVFARAGRYELQLPAASAALITIPAAP